MDELLCLLPEAHRNQAAKKITNNTQELRLAIGQPLMIRNAVSEDFVWPKLTPGQIEQSIQTACRQSVYAYTQTISMGYITLNGGHRLGLCGTGVMDGDNIKIIKNPTSVTIRIAKDILGYSDKMISVIDGSAIIIGPPCSGKTTLLRDAVRQISDVNKQRVGLADERREISAASLHGFRYDMGSRTDVMLDIPKAKAAVIMLRTMNPQWIAMDEITSPEDIGAAELISHCGVKIIASIHADSYDDALKKKRFSRMLASGLFRWAVEMNWDKTYSVKEIEA